MCGIWSDCALLYLCCHIDGNLSDVFISRGCDHGNIFVMINLKYVYIGWNRQIQKNDSAICFLNWLNDVKQIGWVHRQVFHCSEGVFVCALYDDKRFISCVFVWEGGDASNFSTRTEISIRFKIRKGKDYVYGIWVYKVLGIWKGYYRVKNH